jgi:outer membrane protein assembly factor BamB
MHQRHPTQRRFCALLLLVTSLALPAIATDWPQWRGPQRNGTSTESGWLDKWPTQGPPILWKASVGLGYSSFVVADNRAVTLGHAAGQDTVWCFAADTGKVLWKHSYPAELGDKYFEGGTTGTPTIDGPRVYTISRWGDVFCFEAASGKIIWSRNVQKETGARIPDWGFTGAPFLQENRLILNVGDAGLALDKQSGKVLWQSANEDAGYSTPLPFQRDGKSLAVFGNGTSYVAINPADGKEAWRIKWLTEYGVNAADPIISGDQVLLATGYGKGSALFKLGADGPQQVWKNKALRTQLNAGVLVNGFVYGVDGDTTEKASLKCIEFATGTEKWAQRGFGSGGVIVADGKLIAFSGNGELMVAPASPEGFKPTSRAQVLGGKCWTAPVLANGLVYCRNGKGDVVCVDLRKH